MYPLHIKNRPREYELTLQDSRSWKRPLFILLGGFLLGITASLLFVDSDMDLLAGTSAFISISTDVVAFVFLVYRERTQGRPFFVLCIFLLLTLLTFPWLEGLNAPLLWLGGGALLFLVLFFFTYVSAARADKRTRMSVNAFSIALSEERVTVGFPVTISYQLSFKQAILIKMLRITFFYQQYTGQESQGQDAYTLRSVPVYQKDNVMGDPDQPLIEEFQFTIPEDLNALWRERRDWSLDVSIKPDRGSNMLASYALRVLPKPPSADEGPQRIVDEEPLIDEEWLAMGREASEPAADEEAQPIADTEHP